MSPGISNNPDHTHQTETIQVLWTGGWDSTFRLLQLLIVLEKRVQPWYVIDPGRESLAYELRAMQNIRKKFSEGYAHLRENLLPTRFIELQSIPLNGDVLDSINRIRETRRLGHQYDWLSGLAVFYKLTGLEISLEKGGEGIFNFLREKFIFVEDHGYTYFMIDPKFKDSDEYAVFGNFRFPIIEITKPEMEQVASENGFIEILNTSWYCHHPRRNGKPCGVCIPCMGAVEAGMKHRLPVSGRFRYVFRDFLSSDNFKKKFPGMHATGHKWKHFWGPDKKKAPH